MSEKKVILDDAFIDGSTKTDFFVDFKHLNDVQIQSISTFVAKVSNNEPLPGKNKPSWLDDNLQKLPHTDNYEDNNFWHYHCGPNFNTGKSFSMTFNLTTNLNGATSAEVIHYVKVTDDEIQIVGFSPKHQPFPSSDKLEDDNPLFD